MARKSVCCAFVGTTKGPKCSITQTIRVSSVLAVLQANGPKATDPDTAQEEVGVAVTEEADEVVDVEPEVEEEPVLEGVVADFESVVVFS